MSSARNHQKRSHRSYRVTKSICGSVARKAWVTPQHSPKQSGLLALVRRLIRGRAQRTAHSGPQARRKAHRTSAPRGLRERRIYHDE